MDNFALFADSREALLEAREAVTTWLARERHLRLKHPKAPVRSTRRRFTYLGYRISRAGVSPTPHTLKRLEQRVTEHLLHGNAESLERCLGACAAEIAVAKSSGGERKSLQI